jgi:IS605 OrfB family transposase
MREVNHAISKAIAQFADYYDADVVMEDLSGCRGTMRQSKKQRSDAGNSRHRWAFYDLQLKTAYKMELLGRPLILRPAPYTSQSDSRNGILGKRDGHNFVGFDGWQANADWNAARNIAKWDGFACPLGLYVSQDGAFEDPQDFGSPSASGCAEMQMGNGREYAADSLCCGLETGIPVSLDRGASKGGVELMGARTEILHFRLGTLKLAAISSLAG